MQNLVDSLEFELVWCIPFEKDNVISIKYVLHHMDQILGGDCWAAGTLTQFFFNLYDVARDTEEFKTQLQKRDEIFYHANMFPLFDCKEKVYVFMGGNPFRYVTIDYDEQKGLGILCDYQK